MTRAHRVRAGIIAMTVLVVVIAGVPLITHRSQARSLSLVFERYSTRADLFVQDVAFLRLTNSSDRTYCLAMTGGTNTFEWDAPFTFLSDKQPQHSASYMVICEFSGQTPTGSWDLIQQA